MPTMDRRHTPRTKLDQVAYINIEPGNGGIVLNVSGKGLAFHSMVPVKRNGSLRLSLQEQNRRIDICGELVWTDKIQKIGGVRFTTLTPEARDRILDWTSKSEGTNGERFSLGSALLKALPKNDSARLGGPVTSAVAWWKSGKRLRVSGFARGVATGFLLSLIAFSVVLFSYAHRREFGESLIRVGKRLAGTGDSEVLARSKNLTQVTVASSPAVAASSPTKEKSSSIKAAAKADSDQAFSDHASAHNAKLAAEIPVPPAQTRAAVTSKQSTARPGNTHVANLSGVKLPESSTPIPVAPKPATPIISPSPAAELPASMAKPEQQVAMSTHIEPTTSVSLSRPNSKSNVRMFFDLGRFKNQSLAQDLSNQLGQLGIHADVVPRRRLWSNSYQVLVGPYDDEAAEQQLNNQLLAHGYKPRPFERGTREFEFKSRLMIDHSPLPTGDFTIAWESYIGDAKVKFTQDGGVLAAADGKWVKHPAKFSQDEYVYQIQPDGSRPLLEVHFAGMNRALVFRNLR